ncbi:MAG: hypothetical protein ACRCR4_10795 [Thiotrichaceae bacterium]
MAVVTIYRLAEEIMKVIHGGRSSAASSPTIAEIKLSIGQVANELLKADYLNVNVPTGELIPNGAMVATYENITVTKAGNKSQASLPIKPLKMPRNMGVFSVYKSDEPENEFIPLQMGHSSLLRSQPLINDLLGQVGYENFGDKILFTKDLTIPNQTVTVDMRLVVMDVSQYGDYDPLPILPEMEMTIKERVIKLYSVQPIPDKLVDPSVSEVKNVPTNQQSQT